MLFICENLGSETIRRQPWKHVIEVARRIQKSGIEISLTTSGPYDSAGEEILGIPLRRAKKSGLLFDIDSLSRAIKNEDADVINWHCSDVWSSFYFWRLKRRVSKKIVWTLHSGIITPADFVGLGASEYLQLYKYWPNLLNFMLPKSLIRGWVRAPILCHTISLSKRTAGKLADYGLNENRVTPIPSGVDTESFKPSSGSVEDEEILYFGPISSFRGTDVLFSAFEDVRKSNLAAHLVVLSRGDNLDSRWVRRIQCHRTDVEVVEGALEQSKLIEHLNRSSLIVLPFKFWPQVECPLTVLEAMSMEKTVVTTTTGAIPEIVQNGKTGIMVPPNDSKELAHVLRRLLNDKSLCKEIGKRARAYVASFHDWKTVANETLKILTEYVD